MITNKVSSLQKTVHNALASLSRGTNNYHSCRRHIR